MKKISSFLLLTMIFLSSHSQSIVNSNHLWNNVMAIEPTMQLFTESIKFSTDTTMGSFTYKVVERTLDQNQLNWLRYGFIREDANKRVYYKFNASDPDKLIYDLNLAMNDSIMAYGVNTFNFSPYLDSAMYYVTGVDSMPVGATYQKQLHLSSNVGGTMMEAALWVDSMGGMSGILHNWNLKVGEDSYGLLCFKVNGILMYMNPYYTNCFVSTGMELLNSTGAIISLSPNPATNKLAISRKNINSGGQIIIYDGFGKICFRVDNFRNDMIDVSSFPEGIYIIYYSDLQSYAVKKFIVLR